MRVLILSDLHANLQATEAVLSHAAESGWDRALVLGDLVGYGADPAAVIDIVRALPDATIIRGNHDKVISGLDDAEDFHPVARASVDWTIDALDDERLAYLRALPEGPLAIEGLLSRTTICHGAPFDEDHYIFDAGDVEQAFGATGADLILFGHTHVQMAFCETTVRGRRVVTMTDEQAVALHAAGRVLANPGSVGQPRDGDSRAAYAVLDMESGTLDLHRVAYDISEAQRRIRAARLPARLAERLSVGR